MSVAFRRESDEEHLEPKFEIPLPPGLNIVTARGLALIEAKVAEWNASVAAAEDDEARKKAKRDLAYWNTRLSTARVADAPTPGVAGIGSRIAFRLNGTSRAIEIVGHDEADPAAGHLAFAAPLAKSMIGAEVGDLLDFGGVEDALEILSITP
ncbi:GreA/GreB family elongation factor [Sphingomonas sp. SUN039]|uniref:GreA/GreB family elongation factor n=1 Tax=Sphingomonas sp. SUN039 TaxID=2937787 RepID=UPI002164A361|nr:GreA/GreB family elongation factor [Sphingomonas sp. SUN039]UVO53891.1 GreA/GreB family elongation factor [Sphingomonas sp. SUN039]